MPSAEQLVKEPESRFVGLFLGRSGGGKTTALLSFPKPMLVLDMDGRIRGGLANDWIESKGITYESYPPRMKATNVFTKLDKDLEGIYMMTQSGQCPYKTVVLDSITMEAISLLLDAIPLTHTNASGKDSGRKLGTLMMAGPQDYGYQSTAILQTMAFLRSLPIPNIIVTAHVSNRYGKDPSDENKYAPNIIVGEQLNLTDKLAESIPTNFDHIFRFSKSENGPRLQFWAKFRGELERTAFKDLPNGEVEVTGKDFYQWMLGKVRKPVQELIATVVK